MSQPTIRDVSRLAGVSRMTVSRVLSQPALVLPETRERVRAAIATLGYVPNRAAGALASRRTGFIALILPTLTNANFAGVAHGLIEELRPAGYELLIGYTSYGAAEEARQVRTVLSRRPEAVVLTAPVASRESVAMLTRAGIPVVEIADLPDQPLGWAIGFSNVEVGRVAARHLIGLGYRRIAAVGAGSTSDLRDWRGEARLTGFTQELARAGLADDLVLRHGLPPVSFDHGAAAVAEVLRRAPDTRAVFAISDLSAVGAVMACRRRGLDVPGDMSVMGFGDFEIGRLMVPALTTIAVDFPGLGRRAGALLRGILRGVAPEARCIDAGFRLVRREST